jgi:hypothetical protein
MLMIGIVRTVMTKLTTPPMANRIAPRSTKLIFHGETPFISSTSRIVAAPESLSVILLRRNRGLSVENPFRWSAARNAIALVCLNFHVWDEREYEFDEFIHASFSSLLQLKKALEAYQSLMYFGTELDTAIEAPLFLVVRHGGHHLS